MVDFYTQRVAQHWYYSNFFPEKQFTTSEDAIEFEKSITMPNLPKVMSFYERKSTEEASWWTVDSNDNYQTPTSTPGFIQIPYVYQTKKVFIQIESDKISYYYFNEDTMQYELLEEISDDDEYVHSIFYKDPGIEPVDGTNFGPDNDNSRYGDYYLEVKDRQGLIEELTNTSVEGLTQNCIYYAKAEKKYYWKNIDGGSGSGGSSELPKSLWQYARTFIVDEEDIYYCDYGDNDSSTPPTYGVREQYTIYETEEAAIKGQTSTEPANRYYIKEKKSFYKKGTIKTDPKTGKQYIDDADKIITRKIKIIENFKDFPKPLSEYKDTMGIYCRQLNLVYNVKDVDGGDISSHLAWVPIQDGANVLFIKQSSVTEGYMDVNLEDDKDKWYVRICRNIYSVFSWMWRGLVKIGQAIGTFFQNLWAWLRGQRYFGTEITFYWGNNIIEVSSKEVLEQISTVLSRDQIFQSIDTPKKFWYYNYDTGRWEKFNCERWENWIRTTGHYEHVVSRKKDLPTNKSGVYYVTQTQKIYYKLTETGAEWTECPIITDAAMKIYMESQDSDILKKMVFYCRKEKQCYKLKYDSWIEDEEHSSLEGLYEAADALRLVLDYKDYYTNTKSIQNFNSIISTLNEVLGYNFPTNTNTLQPTMGTQGDWGFYYYDKVAGWIKGKEAYDLEIL